MKRGTNESNETLGALWKRHKQKNSEATKSKNSEDFEIWKKSTIDRVSEIMKEGPSVISVDQVPTNIRSRAQKWADEQGLVLGMQATKKPGVYGGGEYIITSYHLKLKE